MREEKRFEEIRTSKGNLIRAWVQGVAFEEKARAQLELTADLPIIYKWVSVMPDVHLGRGSTVGSVIPTKAAIIPAAVGVDLGCGMQAQRLSLRAGDLPTNLKGLRESIERAVPHGRSGWGDHIPSVVTHAWRFLRGEFQRIVEKCPAVEKTNHISHLGTLGTGNHFIELCIDKENHVWVMLHSGSRGVGNFIGTHFIELAKKDTQRRRIHLPDMDLAYLQEGSVFFDDYWHALSWGQKYAKINRQIMMERVLGILRNEKQIPRFRMLEDVIDCHHNYAEREVHFGETVYVTRKGAVRARKGDLGIIPGSMGARSYIVRGKGSEDSFASCSHGAGRLMSRTEARILFSKVDHIVSTAGVECRKDEKVIDETPRAFKPIEDVIAAQSDLVDVVYELKQVLCVKG